MMCLPRGFLSLTITLLIQLVPIGCRSGPAVRAGWEDQWGLILAEGLKAGHFHQERSRIQDGGRTLVRTRLETVFRAPPKSGEHGRLSTKVEFVETEQGKVVRLEVSFELADEKEKVRGRLSAELQDGKMMTMMMTQSDHDDEEERFEVEWDPETIGRYGMERLMRENGLGEGTSYEAKVCREADLRPKGALRFRVAGKERVHVLGEEISLTRIDTEDEATGKRVCRLWVDDRFRPIREESELFIPIHGMEGNEVVRCWVTREEALETVVGERPTGRDRR